MSTREDLAAYAHDAWAGWMRYMFGISGINSDQTATIPARLVNRWLRQSATAYSELPDQEKLSDLAEADKILALFAPDPLAEALAVHARQVCDWYEEQVLREAMPDDGWMCFEGLRAAVAAWREAHPEEGQRG